MVGQTAQVTVTIPKGGIGQVRMTMGESVVEKIARAQDGEEIPVGALVNIEAIIGEDILVRRSGNTAKLETSKGN
jgi:hypothetical protein